MPDLSKWRGSSRRVIGNIVPSERASDAWRRIQRDPQVITFVRGGAELPPQTVRVVMGTETNEREGTVGDGVRRVGYIFGVRSHPTVSDTDIKAGDRFAVNVGTDEVPQWVSYTVRDVDYRPGEVQARIQQVT